MASSITNNPPGQRELVYCHSCREEWYRDEFGLVCPRCGGDFVEIIENTNDPRGPAAPLLGLPEDFPIEDDDDDGGHDHDHDHDHHPRDPHRAATFVRIDGPGFSYTSAQRNFGPRSSHRHRPDAGEGGHDHSDDMMVQLFTNMLRNIVGDVAGGGGGGGGGTGGGGGGSHSHSPGLGAGHTPGGGAGGSAGASPHAHTPMPSLFASPPAFGRWPYDPNARLNPRDADSPQPHEENVLDLPTFLASFFGPGAADTGGMLARVLGIPPGAGGDYVYSQADLDRVISQLMEQHQGNAPPPAAKDTIEALPKVRVTAQMVIDGQDCAVCKEDLVAEEEVRKLPCNHMYHYECVSRWLEAHDTCPICRHPVTPEDQRPAAPSSPHSQPASAAGGRPHPPPAWPFGMGTARFVSPNSASSSSSPAPPEGSGSSSSSSGTRSSGHGHSWAGLFRRGGNDRA